MAYEKLWFRAALTAVCVARLPMTAASAKGFSLGRALIALAAGLYALLLFIYCQSRPTILDEDQFLAAAHLLGAYLPYRDYIYFQTPLYPLFLAGLQELFGETGLFSMARSASWFFGLGTLAAVHLIARRLTGAPWQAWLVTLLTGLSPLLLVGVASARNDIMPVFLGLSGLALAFPYLQAPPLEGGQVEGGQAQVRTRLFLSGLCLALAVATKLTAAFLPLVLLIVLLIKARRGGSLPGGWGSLFAFIAGGALGALPILLFAALAPEQFFLDVFAFHRSAPFLWYQEIGEAEKLEWRALSAVAASILGQDPSILLALLFCFAVTGSAALKSRLDQLHERLARNGGYVILALLGSSLLLCAQPKPHLIHYFIPAAPFFLLAAAALAPGESAGPWPAGATARQRALRGLGLLLCFLPLATPQVRSLLLPSAQTLSPDSWTGNKVAAASEKIAGELAPRDPLRPLAALNPIYVIDAGLPLMPEFASSIFFYRTADHETPETVRKVKGLSPSLVSEVLDEARPSAVLIGAEFDFLAAPLLEWALTSGYREVASPGEGLRLFLAPAGD